MLVVHMDSGLGNQMLDYAEYLAIKEANPDKEICIETIIYDISGNHDGMFSQWNGYELERIFGIKASMLKETMEKDAWKRVVAKTEKSEFWNNCWNYAPVITQALNDEGYKLINMQKNSRQIYIDEHKRKACAVRQLLRSLFTTAPGYFVKRCAKRVFQSEIIRKENAKFDMYQKYNDNVYTGHSLLFKYKGFGLERIDSQVRKCFIFPDITDDNNLSILSEIHSCNSVAIHARRSDMLFLNDYCYKFGYFKRAVKYIKRHVSDPVFFFFCDDESRGWCEKNEDVFDLDSKTDKIKYITWNSGKESYRDMQLMAECKNNIFTESSFGFWGAYLNKNPNKITCSPDPTIISTNWF